MTKGIAEVVVVGLVGFLRVQQPAAPAQLTAPTHTEYSAKTELFAEWRPFIVGEPTRLAAHLTHTGDRFQAFADGHVASNMATLTRRTPGRWRKDLMICAFSSSYPQHSQPHASGRPGYLRESTRTWGSFAAVRPSLRPKTRTAAIAAPGGQRAAQASCRRSGAPVRLRENLCPRLSERASLRRE